MDIQQKFGDRIKKLRLEKSLSQEALALAAELDRTYLPSIEKGKRNVSLAVAKKIANALGMTLSELVSGL